jgi:hypothetical protein
MSSSYSPYTSRVVRHRHERLKTNLLYHASPRKRQPPAATVARPCPLAVDRGAIRGSFVISKNRLEPLFSVAVSREDPGHGSQNPRVGTAVYSSTPGGASIRQAHPTAAASAYTCIKSSPRSSAGVWRENRRSRVSDHGSGKTRSECSTSPAPTRARSRASRAAAWRLIARVLDEDKAIREIRDPADNTAKSEPPPHDT